MDVEQVKNVMKPGGPIRPKIMSRQRMQEYYLGPGNKKDLEQFDGRKGMAHPFLKGFPPECQSGMVHPWLAPKQQMAIESVGSDTRKDLVQELVAKGLTRQEAVEVVAEMVKKGFLREVYDQDLGGKVLVR